MSTRYRITVNYTTLSSAFLFASLKFLSQTLSCFANHWPIWIKNNRIGIAQAPILNREGRIVGARGSRKSQGNQQKQITWLIGTQ